MSVSILMYNNSTNPINFLKNTGFENSIIIYGESGPDWYAETTGALEDVETIPKEGIGVVERVSNVKFEETFSIRLFTQAVENTVQTKISQDLILEKSAYTPNKYWNISAIILGDRSKNKSRLLAKVTFFRKVDEDWEEVTAKETELRPTSDTNWNMKYFYFKLPILNNSGDVKLVFSFININTEGFGSGEYHIDNVKVATGANPTKYVDENGNPSQYNSFSLFPGIGRDGSQDPEEAPPPPNSSGGISISQGIKNRDGQPEGEKDCLQEYIDQMLIEIQEVVAKQQEVVNTKPMTWMRDIEDIKTKFERKILRECVKEEKNQSKKGNLKNALDALNANRRKIEARFHLHEDGPVWGAIDNILKEEYLRRSIDRSKVVITPDG